VESCILLLKSILGHIGLNRWLRAPEDRFVSGHRFSHAGKADDAQTVLATGVFRPQTQRLKADLSRVLFGMPEGMP
jgi:hypothetical protein